MLAEDKSLGEKEPARKVIIVAVWNGWTTNEELDEGGKKDRIEDAIKRRKSKRGWGKKKKKWGRTTGEGRWLKSY